MNLTDALGRVAVEFSEALRVVQAAKEEVMVTDGLFATIFSRKSFN